MWLLNGPGPLADSGSFGLWSCREADLRAPFGDGLMSPGQYTGRHVRLDDGPGDLLGCTRVLGHSGDLQSAGVDTWSILAILEVEGNPPGTRSQWRPRNRKGPEVTGSLVNREARSERDLGITYLGVGPRVLDFVPRGLNESYRRDHWDQTETYRAAKLTGWCRQRPTRSAHPECSTQE